MVIRAAPKWVFPQAAILFKAIDRPGIRIQVVEAPNLICDIK
jgi:hypothetical protein